MKIRLNKNKAFAYFIVFVVFFTNITQIPQIVSLGITSIISMSIWLIALFVIILQGKLYYKNILCLLIIVVTSFLLFILINQSITGNEYIHSSILYPFLLSIFVLFIGLQSSFNINLKHYDYIYYSYILSGVIVSIFVFIDIISSGFSWSSIGYAYTSKNSVSQIILTVFILLIFVKFPAKKSLSFFRFLLSIFLIVLLCMLKSRATLIGLALLLFVFLSNKNIKLSSKFIVSIAIVIGIFVILSNENLHNIIVDNIFFANRDSMDLNSLSSGRYDMYKEFPRMFGKNPIIGRGSYYIESFPLSILLQYGIFGSIPIIIFLLLPFFYFIFTKEKKKDYNVIIFFSITICYYFNGIFEELSPLGPGVKCYFLWLLLGLLIGRKELRKLYVEKKNIRNKFGI